MTQAQLSSDEAKQVVLNLGTAMNDESFQTARIYVADDMKYKGPFGARVGAEAYLEEIERLRLKFHIQRIFANHKYMCVLYNIGTAVLQYSPAVGLRSKTEWSPPFQLVSR